MWGYAGGVVNARQRHARVVVSYTQVTVLLVLVFVVFLVLVVVVAMG